MGVEQIAIQGLLFFLDLYKTHQNKAKDWVPSEEEIAALRMLNLRMTAFQYESELAQKLGLPVPPNPFAPSPTIVP